MSVLSLSYWESDVYWRHNNKHFAELAHKMAGNSWYEEITSVSPCVYKARLCSVFRKFEDYARCSVRPSDLITWPKVEESVACGNMSSKGDSKPGFFKRLFGGGSSKKSGEGSSSSRADGGASSSRHGSSSESSPTKMKPSHSPLLAPPVKTRTSSSGSSGGGGGRSPTAADAAQAERKPRRQTSGGQKKARSQKHRKRTKTLIDPGAIKVSLLRALSRGSNVKIKLF